MDDRNSIQESDVFDVENCFPQRRYIPRRFLVIIACFLGTMLAFMHRVCISVTITGSEGMASEFGWDNTQKGYVLSSYYWGYICAQLFWGYLSIRYGARYVLGFGCFFLFIFSALTTVTSYSFGLLIATRVIMGLFGASCVPTGAQLTARWIPPKERSRAASVLASGSCLAAGLTLFITPQIMAATSWRTVIYVYGICGLLWCFTWYIWGQSRPEDSTSISPVEADYIKRSLNLNVQTGVGNPWKAIFLSITVWAPIAGHIAFNWSYYTLISFLPEYFHTVLGFKMTTGGVYQVIPYIIMVICAIGSSRIIEVLTGAHGGKARMTLLASRKFIAVLGYVVPAAFLCVIGYLPAAAAITFMTLAVGFTGLASSVFFANYNDIVPYHAGIAMGLSNTMATIPGIVSPILGGYLLDAGNCKSEADQNDDHYDEPESCINAWRTIFFIAAGIQLVGFTILYVFIRTSPVVDENGNSIKSTDENHKIDGGGNGEYNRLE